MAVRAQVVAILVDDLGWQGDPDTLDDATDLIEQGVLDSLMLIDFVNLLEQRFAIRIEDTELLPENFQSIGAVVAFVSPKLAP